MNTEGYSKQKANLGTLAMGLPISSNVYNQVKTSCGVELINVQRYTASFESSYYNDQLSKQAYLNQKSQGLEGIANLFDELQGQGLDTALTDFYDALNNLNQYPTDMAARINFLDKASVLTDSMNSLSSNLTSMKNTVLGDGQSTESLQNSSFYSSLNTLNGSLTSLAKINNMIAQSQTGTLENNNLLDQRDALLSDLAQYADFTVNLRNNGVADLSLNGVKLVSGSNVEGTFDAQTAQQYDNYCNVVGIENTNTCNAVLMIKKSNGTVIQNANNKVSSGTLGALLNSEDAASKTIDKTIAQLDALAQTVADVFNNLQTREGAFYLDYSTGKAQLCNDNLSDYAIFVTKDGSSTVTSANIKINDLLTTGDGYNKVAAAYVEGYDPLDPTTVDKNAVGNAENVVAMIKTQSDASSPEFATIGHVTFGEYYNGIIAQVTSNMEATQSEADAQDAIVNSLQNQKASETSVDLNEELTDLVKAQTAYSASARVFSVCNEVLDTLISLGR